MSVRIEIEDLWVQLGQRAVLRDVSTKFQADEIVGVVGPNGAGKSTLLRAIANLQPLTKGDITLNDQPLGTHSLKALSQHLAYLPQLRPVAWNINVEDLAALGRFSLGAGRYVNLATADKAQVDTALEQAGAAAFVGRSIHTLSGGEQARVHLARILASPAHTLLLDEPCAALDIAHQLDLMEALKSESRSGRTIILALHDLNLARRFCDRIIVLHAGQKMADAVPGEALSESILKNVFGVSDTLAGFARA